ncbi:hypothetical protein BEP19_09645 [Ammoniphilus oxalaticus]|uniref:Uncharacterized protein n=1 Tax=Ammoniphilus oxalaticus TaxID=66863 RepID=A0A419SKT6_9BACL|nr:hypothetical protein [Ammoniphilus oxalaticus]RKD24627.1 hypothetical protein BEP19_09645 [Ammoniphilus oxalaticus]
MKEAIDLFKLILNQSQLLYGEQDKVNMKMKEKPRLSVLRHNIDDIKYEVMKLQREHPGIEIVFVGV